MTGQMQPQEQIERFEATTPDRFSRVQQDEFARSSPSVNVSANFDLLHYFQAVAGAALKIWDRQGAHKFRD